MFANVPNVVARRRLLRSSLRQRRMCGYDQGDCWRKHRASSPPSPPPAPHPPPMPPLVPRDECECLNRGSHGRPSTCFELRWRIAAAGGSLPTERCGCFPHAMEATCVTLLANAHLKETRLQGTKAFSGAIAPPSSHARRRRRPSHRSHRPSKPKSFLASIRLPTTWARLTSKLTRGLAMRSGSTSERDGTRVYRVKGAMKPLRA